MKDRLHAPPHTPLPSPPDLLRPPRSRGGLARRLRPCWSRCVTAQTRGLLQERQERRDGARTGARRRPAGDVQLAAGDEVPLVARHGARAPPVALAAPPPADGPLASSRARRQRRQFRAGSSFPRPGAGRVEHRCSMLDARCSMLDAAWRVASSDPHRASSVERRASAPLPPSTRPPPRRLGCGPAAAAGWPGKGVPGHAAQELLRFEMRRLMHRGRPYVPALDGPRRGEPLDDQTTSRSPPA